MVFRPSAADLEAFEKASSIEAGGMSAFTAHFFSPVGGLPRWDLVATPPDVWNLETNQFVPWVPLPWQRIVAHDARMDATIIGGFASGKTIGIGACAVYWCCMTSNFKFMNCAPVGWQAKQMYDKVRQDLFDWENRFERPRYIIPYVKKIVQRPYPVIEFTNGSTMEFMSGDEQGAKIRSWEGDAASIDEAGLMDDLDELLMNLGSRMRGLTGGRARMGKLILLSNADYNPELWEQFDMWEELPDDYYSILLTTYHNPYLTEAQVKALGRRIKDPIKRKQMMFAERPLPRGQEFTPALLEQCKEEALDEQMNFQLQQGTVGFRREEMPRAGIWNWEIPYNDLSKYILVGDPGQNSPPNRNSPCIGVFDVSGFPDAPASLAAFWWGDGRGSYWPFIYKYEEYFRRYKPISAGFDATGVQKGFDELVFQQRNLLVEGINMQGLKQQMVVTLKLIMGRGLIAMPKDIAGIWLQLAGWHMPDRKLRQDVASMLFMTGYLLQRLFVMGEMEAQVGDTTDDGLRRDRNVGARIQHGARRARRERHSAAEVDKEPMGVV